MRSVVLVSGATGVLGSRLVRALVEAGRPVRALVQPRDPFRERLAGTGCQIHEGDVEQASSLRGACDGVGTVYHLAAVILPPEPTAFERINRQGTGNLVDEAARGAVEHFVYVSSASVTYPRRTRYAESKLAGEALVTAEHRFRHTIVRPTLVYDEGGGQELLLFWRYLERFPIVPFIGNGRARKRPVWAGDVVDGLLRIAGNERAHGKTYNFSGPDCLTIAELGRLLLAHRGLHRPFMHLPVRLCRAIARLAGLLVHNPRLSLQAIAGMVNHADLSPEEAMRDLGYRPIGIREGLARCFPAPGPDVRAPREELVT